jgi:hypothetical protein
VFASLVLTDRVQFDGPEKVLTLVNVEAKSWIARGSEALVDVVAFMSFYFLNARLGEHPIRLVVANAQGEALHTFDTEPVNAEGTAFVCASAMPLYGLKLPIGLNSLYLLVDGEVRAAAGLHVLPPGTPTRS